ncbi:MAG: hypothetical protein NTX82_02745 [Candidatus Parcubacteria bacterium]|nr:hypothetical protein [Candidatus Parcubacteria bacterium]
MNTMILIVGGIFLGFLVLVLYIRINIKMQEQQAIMHVKRLFAEAESYGMNLLQIRNLAISIWEKNQGLANQADVTVEEIINFVSKNPDEKAFLAMAALLLNALLLFEKNIAAVLLKAICKQQQIDRAKLIARILVMSNTYIVRLWNSYIDSTFKDPQLSADLKKEFAVQSQK